MNARPDGKQKWTERATALRAKVEPVVVGKPKLGDDERASVERAVRQAEDLSGLQFLVYVGRSAGDPRAEAKRLLANPSYRDVPAVLLFVESHRHRIEIVTNEPARARVSDADCRRAVDIMVPALQRSDWVAGLELGIASLVEAAGTSVHGSHPTVEVDLPNVIE